MSRVFLSVNLNVFSKLLLSLTLVVFGLVYENFRETKVEVGVLKTNIECIKI